MACAEPTTVRVHIAPPRAGQRLRIAPVHNDDAVALNCDAECVLDLVPGHYRLELFDRDGRSLGSTRVDADIDALWRITPPDRTAYWAGLTTGIAGATLIMAGFFLISPVLPIGGNECHNDCATDTQRRWAGIGFASILVGAIATPIGWVTFAHNRRPSVESAAPPPLDPPPRFSAAITPGGAALSMQMAF